MEHQLRLKTILIGVDMNLKTVYVVYDVWGSKIGTHYSQPRAVFDNFPDTDFYLKNACVADGYKLLFQVFTINEYRPPGRERGGGRESNTDWGGYSCE
jgi:hypothetical protein